VTIIIDVGCAKHGGDESMPYLAETFEPRALYGFDPAEPEADYFIGETVVCVRPWAAWTYDGTIGFKVAGIGGQVMSGAPDRTCFDLARFVNELPDEEIILKMDAEGAEYELLPHLREHDADLRLKLLWVEWHCEVCKLGGNGRHRENCRADAVAWTQRRAHTESHVRCELAEWNR
jgi:hypothetical protein